MKNCSWITIPNAEKTGNKIYYFKKSFTIKHLEKTTIDISAQARYKLYINGFLCGVGPCKGTNQKKYYDSIDVTGYVREGANDIFVELLQLISSNMEGEMSPLEGVLRIPTALLAAELSCEDMIVQTDESWECAKIDGIEFLNARSCYSANIRENVFSNQVENAKWTNAVKLCNVSNGEDDHYWWGATNACFLFERPIPMLDFSDKTKMISFKNNLFESPYLTFGFPSFHLKGKGVVNLCYFECFDSDKGKTTKDRTNHSLGYCKEMIDTVYVDGEYEFEPFWFRCFRYIKVETKGTVKISLDKFLEVNYPMTIRNSYDFGNDEDNKLWDISVRTLQRCMHETYEDCPFYEQLQYAMDTSIQMLFNYQLTDDDRLARKAMDDFADAQLANGLMPSRTPCVTDQHIPSFQFYFIFMVYEHYIRFGDLSLVRKYLRAIDGIIEWFKALINEDGVIGQSKYWNFIDWAKPWVYDKKRGCEGGVPLGVNEGVIGIYNPMMAYFLQCAAKLNSMCGRNDVANEYLTLADTLLENTNKYFWDDKKGLYADDVNHIYYSQHMQTWCVLSGCAKNKRARQIMKNSLDLDAKATFAFAYFYFRALEICDMYDKTSTMMQMYRDLLKLNCTTIPETPTESRSDCHAWGALAIYEFSAKILGVRTENVTENSVSINPYIVGRDHACGTVSTIGGDVYVSWRKERNIFYISVVSKREIEKVIYLPNGKVVRMNNQAINITCDLGRVIK